MSTRQEIKTPLRVVISNFFFRLFFRQQWRHMSHLIDDIIYLEQLFGYEYRITTSGNSKTAYFEED